MSGLILRQIDSPGALREVAGAWDRLWQRCDVSLPTVRAELVAQWIERFFPRAALRILAVERDGDLVAALPICGCRVRRLLPVGDLTSNYWSTNGELLLDPSAGTEAVLDRLIDGLERSPWPLLWFDLVPYECPQWKRLIERLSLRGLAVDLHPRYSIGRTEIEGSFDAYFARRSRDHRRGVVKRWRRLEQAGPVRWRLHADFDPHEVEARLHEAFRIESQSWKQGNGQSVLETPGMFDFYLRQARQLARWGYLRIAFLEHRGEPIAFELGWTAKGVYHSYKVGYVPECARYGPGHLLRMRIIEWLHNEPGHAAVDYQGPLTDAVAQWSTGAYPIGRLVIAPQRLLSRTLLRGYRSAAGVARRVRAIHKSDGNGTP